MTEKTPDQWKIHFQQFEIAALKTVIAEHESCADELKEAYENMDFERQQLLVERQKLRDDRAKFAQDKKKSEVLLSARAELIRDVKRIKTMPKKFREKWLKRLLWL